MAAIALTHKDENVTNQEAAPVVPTKPNKHSGRQRYSRIYFFPLVAVAATSVIALAKLPAGCRIINIKILSNAFVATSTMDVGLAAVDGSGDIDGTGTSDSATFFTTGGTLAVASAGKYEAADTQVNNSDYELKKECYIIAKLNTAGMDGVADILQGYVTYVID